MLTEEWAFPEKKLYPLLRISVFLKLNWISSQIYRDLAGIFHYFTLTPLEINVFPSIFGVPPRNSTTFALPPFNFPLLCHANFLRKLTNFIDGFFLIPKLTRK